VVPGNQVVDIVQRLLHRGLEPFMPAAQARCLLRRDLKAGKRGLDPLECLTDRRLFHDNVAIAKSSKGKKLADVVHSHFDVLTG
jgi:hypothetical protein